MSIFIALVACPSEQVAASLAQLLVHRELAACAQVLPSIQSVYRWQGRVCIEKESLLIIKSSLACKDAVKKAIEENHPYEVPQFLAFLPCDISEKYEEWLLANVRHDLI